MNYTVALAEDNAVNRHTFLQKINMLGNLQVAFVAVNGHDCMEQIEWPAPAKIPQVIFMDLEMPGMDGAEAIRLSRSLYPQIHFIVLTVFDEEDKIFEAIKAGASGYLLKHESSEILQEAVVNVLEYGGAPHEPGYRKKGIAIDGAFVVAGKGRQTTFAGMDHFPRGRNTGTDGNGAPMQSVSPLTLI